MDEPMARVINRVAMSLDGVIEPVSPEWFVAEGGHDVAAQQLLAESEAMLLGRTTFEGLAGFWATQTGPWADIINPMPKYVASRSTLSDLEWNGRPIEGDAIEGVLHLKSEVDGDLLMSGCGELARELIQAGLVDEASSGSTRRSRAREATLRVGHAAHAARRGEGVRLGRHPASLPAAQRDR